MKEQLTEREKDQIRREQEQAKGIYKTLEDGGTLQLYASDGKGVYALNSLLSEEQQSALESMVSEFMEQFVDDCEGMLSEGAADD